MVDESIIFLGMGAVPIITALLQAVKRWLPDGAEPFVAVALGVAWQVGMTAGTDEFTRSTVFLGVVMGLAAAGLYSSGHIAITTAERLRNGNGSS